MTPAPSLPPAAEANVALWLERNARERGRSHALQDDWRALDHAALADRVARCAQWLRTHGLRRGDRIALLLGNRSPAVEFVFAAARIGAIAVPMNARLTAPEVAQLLRDCDSAILIDAMPMKLFDTNYKDVPVYYFTKGERKSSSIAAASIIAKVKRDSLMELLAKDSRFRK